MSIKTLTQFDCLVAPTAENNFVRLRDMREYIAGMTAEPVRVVLTVPFVGSYDPGDKQLIQTTAAELVIDGVTVAVGNRVLVTGQADATQNGIYTVTAPGSSPGNYAVLTRANDFDQSSHFVNGKIVPVSEGDANVDTRWRMSLGALPFVLDAVTVSIVKETVDFTRVIQALLPLEGDASTTTYQLNHNWNTLNILHEVYDEATGQSVMAPPLIRVDANNVEMEFSAPLGVNNDLVLVLHAEVNPA